MRLRSGFSWASGISCTQGPFHGCLRPPEDQRRLPDTGKPHGFGQTPPWSVLSAWGSGPWCVEVAKRSQQGRRFSHGALSSGQHRAIRDGDAGCQPRGGGLAQGCEPPGAGADHPLPEEGGERRELHQHHHAAGLGEASFGPSSQVPHLHGKPRCAWPCARLPWLLRGRTVGTFYRGAGTSTTADRRGRPGGTGPNRLWEESEKWPLWAKRTPKNPTHQLPTAREHPSLQHIWTTLLVSARHSRDCKNEFHMCPAPKSV